MALQIIGGDLQNQLKIGPTPKSLFTTTYAAATGEEIIIPQQYPSYTAFLTAGLACGAAPTDVFSFSGSSSKKVYVTSMWISTIQATGAGINKWFILHRNTPNIGGTFTGVNPIQIDSNDRNSSVNSILQYTVKPTTLGNINLTGGSGTLWSGNVSSPLVTTAAVAVLANTTVNFVELYGRPIILRSEFESLNWNMAGATIANGGTAMSVLCGVTYFEQP